MPQDWWASPPLLKSLEAAGFSWVQVHAPPPDILASPSLGGRHASALAASLGTTGLRCVVHAPSQLEAGTRAGDRAFEGLLSYAAEVGAAYVVYHAMALPDGPESEERLLGEERSLILLARLAQRLETTIAVENLAPLYPGPEPMSANPMSLRALANRVGSDHLGLCLDLGHAHVTADQRHTSLECLCEPVLDRTCLFHVHDNLGARRGGAPPAGVDPLRLDLHLPPGRGTLPWARIAPLIARHQAPLVMEIHPPYRSRAATMHGALLNALAADERPLAPSTR